MGRWIPVWLTFSKAVSHKQLRDLGLWSMPPDVILNEIGLRRGIILAWIVFTLEAARAVTFQIADPVEFSKIIDTNAVLTTNATINTWLEGPTWIPSGGGYLVFCDQ